MFPRLFVAFFARRKPLRPRSHGSVFRCAGLVVIPAVLSVGCAVTSARHEVLEAAIRDRESEIAHLNESLEQTRAQLSTSRREADVLHRQLSKSNPDGPLPEQVRQLAEIDKIHINTLLSGGLDTNQSSADDTLHLVLEPLDAEDDLIKVPGEFHIQLRNENQLLDEWKIAAVDSMNHWKSAGLTHGFVLSLPLPPRLPSDRPHVHVRMTTADGRTFKSDAEVRVTTTPRAMNRQVRNDRS